MSVTATAVLDVARRELGTAESPAGSNKVRYSSWYGLVGPWCAMFVSWCAMTAGAGDIIPKFAFCTNGVAWFKARGRFHNTPQVGDIVFYNISGLGRPSHTGIVEQVHGDGTWTAIEGNTDSKGGRTGGRVMRQRRSKVGVGGGFGRPAYGSAPVSAAPPPASGVDREHVKALQRLVGTPADGAWGPGSDRCFGALIDAFKGGRGQVRFVQGLLGVAADGAWGPRTQAAATARCRALQAFCGTAADGVWGPASQAAADRVTAGIRGR